MNLLPILFDFNYIIIKRDKINNEYITGIVEDYDAIIESADIVFPLKIRKRIKNQYENKLEKMVYTR